MIDDLWNFDDPQASEASFRAHLEESQGEEKEETLTQLARSLGLQRRFDEANEILDQVQPLTKRVAIRLELERGRVLNSSGNREEARPHFLAAWETACQAHEDTLAVDAAHMVAIVEPFEESVDWNMKGLALAESSNDPKARLWRGSLLNNLGWSYHDAGDYQQALAHFERALSACEERGDPNRIRVARWTVARALRSVGRVQEALDIQLELLPIVRAAGRTDKFVLEEIEACRKELGGS